MSSLNYASLRTVGGFDFKVLEDNSGYGGLSTLSIKGPDGWKVAVIDARGRSLDDQQYSLVPRRDVVERFYNVYRASGGGFVLGKRAFLTNRERLATRDASRALFGLHVVVDTATGHFVSSAQV